MAALMTAEDDSLAAKFVADVAHMSLHSADPGTTGASETTAARVVPSLSHTNGVVSLASAAAFTGGAANGAVTWVGFWNAGNVFIGKLQITTGDTTFNSAGAYTVDNISLTIA